MFSLHVSFLVGRKKNCQKKWFLFFVGGHPHAFSNNPFFQKGTNKNLFQFLSKQKRAPTIRNNNKKKDLSYCIFQWKIVKILLFPSLIMKKKEKVFKMGV